MSQEVDAAGLTWQVCTHYYFSIYKRCNNVTGEDDQFIHDTGNIIKSAYHRACENAFSKIALAIFKQRKPFVFVVKQDDHYLNSVQSYVDSVLLHPK